MSDEKYASYRITHQLNVESEGPGEPTFPMIDAEKDRLLGLLKREGYVVTYVGASVRITRPCQ